MTLRFLAHVLFLFALISCGARERDVFQGPVGPIGPIGPQGPRGDTGTAGPAGPSAAPGLVWVDAEGQRPFVGSSLYHRDSAGVLWLYQQQSASLRSSGGDFQPGTYFDGPNCSGLDYLIVDELTPGVAYLMSYRVNENAISGKFVVRPIGLKNRSVRIRSFSNFLELRPVCVDYGFSFSIDAVGRNELRDVSPPNLVLVPPLHLDVLQ